jgi:hypothetical protein
VSDTLGYPFFITQTYTGKTALDNTSPHPMPPMTQIKRGEKKSNERERESVRRAERERG